ncbi:S1/P1 nuclease [Flavobacteriaceae bacterium TP-CH-4]|uniref:S1/P1 nuclease n=1 Tax=Pelagihabitans pacificus TaxID=2696054 RepID=A0A967E796_9FLAO|nr:S1/P1 nuclease [Pelagihabitans pacificus]NHF61352.1 S1/P1 nuclease [Pelagihabitans pacificus]
MKKIVFLLFFLSQIGFANDGVWSKTGHRTIGEIAQQHLSRKARKAIGKLLEGQSLASVSNFADEIKADSTYRKFSAWHYVNYPADKKYGEETPSPYGDLMIGIEKCIAIVKDENSSKEDKAFYLKMLVHLIGDLHQPMHVGRLEDKGGNDIQLQWFGNGSNLHRVWDANMINDYGMSYTELAASLPKWSKNQQKAIQQGTIYDWVEESQDIANELYESVEVGEKLAYRYAYVWWDTVETQLQKGGLRLAKVLNELFQKK